MSASRASRASEARAVVPSREALIAVLEQLDFSQERAAKKLRLGRRGKR